MDARKGPVRVRVGAETVARRRKGEGRPVGENPRVKKAPASRENTEGPAKGSWLPSRDVHGQRVRSRRPARRVGRNAAKAPKR